MKITEETIELIVEELHERVQFYDGLGQKDNTNVLAQIEGALKLAFCQPSKNRKTLPHKNRTV